MYPKIAEEMRFEAVVTDSAPTVNITYSYYYHENSLGSVAALTDTSANIVERYTYDPYGKPEFRDANNNLLAQQISTVGNYFLFTGMHYDYETGLSQVRHRYLNHSQGRFNNIDPVGIWHRNITLGNGYQYALNNPGNKRDLLGLDVWSGTGTVSGGFLWFVGVASFIGDVENLTTGEICRLEVYCLQVGGGWGGALGRSAVVFDGPREGKDLQGNAPSAFLAGSFPSFIPGVSVDVGAELSTEGGVASGGIGGGPAVGVGAELAAGGQWCWSKVSGCKKECKEGKIESWLPKKPMKGAEPEGGEIESHPRRRQQDEIKVNPVGSH